MIKPLIIGVALSGIVTVSAQNPLPVKKITMFKNGTALMVKEGNKTVKDGMALLPIPSEVLFGTYFLGSGKDNAVRNVVFRNDTLKKKEQSKTVLQFLAGNLNKGVTIYYNPLSGDKVDRTVSGRVTEFDINNPILKLVSDAGKTMIIPVANIYQADFKDDPNSFYQVDSIKRMMVLKPEKAGDNISLQEIYMTRGFTWIPSYYLKIKDGKTARLEMKATLENFSEDLADAETELIVGAPQMAYSGKLDPMTYNYLTTDELVTNRSKTRSDYFQANDFNSFKGNAADTAYFDMDFGTSGEKVGDLYVYKLGKITLPKQAKGTFPIFAGILDYKDKYEGTISDVTNFYYTRAVPPDEKAQAIYHSLEITNTSGVPLTTASVMVLNDKDQFVAQDDIKYTPAGANTNIRLSKAIDIVMKNSEEEKSREDNAKRIARVSYSKVVLKGNVTLNNYQDKEVTVSITKSLNGTVHSQSDGGKLTTQKSRAYVNPANDIVWEVTLAANEKKILTYEYEVFFTP